jgi:small conductance mechanosensitive channel
MIDIDDSDIFQRLDQVALFEIALIVVGAIVLANLSQRVLPWLADRVVSRYRYVVLGFVPILRLLIIVVALGLIIPQIIEPTFTNLFALLGTLGIALGFALKEYVSSLIAGIVTLYERPYHPGDWIEFDGAYGEVKAVNTRSLDLLTPDDTIVVIPHLKLWDHLIFNANDGGPSLQCTANFYLHPRHDAALIRNILYEVALTSVFLQIEKPIITTVQEQPWGTHYQLRAYPIDGRQQFQFISDLTVRGKAALTSLEVEFVTASIAMKSELKA